MIKPVRPKKPTKPKISAPNDSLHQTYCLIDDYNVTPSCLKLILAEEFDSLDHKNEDYSLNQRISLVDLQALCKAKGLEDKYITLEACGGDRYETDELVIYYTKPLDAKTLEEQRTAHYASQAQALTDYQTKLEEYQRAIVEYKTQMAEYNVWAAEQKLQRLRNGS